MNAESMLPYIGSVAVGAIWRWMLYMAVTHALISIWRRKRRRMVFGLVLLSSHCLAYSCSQLIHESIPGAKFVTYLVIMAINLQLIWAEVSNA